MTQDDEAQECFAAILEAMCSGCGRKEYTGTRYYMIANLLAGRDMTCWLCQDCNTQLLSNAVGACSMGYSGIPLDHVRDLVKDTAEKRKP